jgi:hypothetical protein
MLDAGAAERKRRVPSLERRSFSIGRIAVERSLRPAARMIE